VFCILPLQPCPNLAAECSWFVHNAKRRRTRQCFADVRLELSKGLVNQEKENAPPALELAARTSGESTSRKFMRAVEEDDERLRPQIAPAERTRGSR
jgi:hypothetical protein